MLKILKKFLHYTNMFIKFLNNIVKIIWYYYERFKNFTFKYDRYMFKAFVTLVMAAIIYYLGSSFCGVEPSDIIMLIFRKCIKLMFLFLIFVKRYKIYQIMYNLLLGFIFLYLYLFYLFFISVSLFFSFLIATSIFKVYYWCWFLSHMFSAFF